MSLWRRGHDDADLGSAGAYYGESAVTITRFEYIPVGDVALTRITARAQDVLPEPSDVSLVVRNGRGNRKLDLLPDSRFDPSGRWRIAFAAPLESLRKPDVTFALQVGDVVLDLPAPTSGGRARRFERDGADETAQLKLYLEEAERDRDAARDVAALLRAEAADMREQIAALESERDDFGARASAAIAAAQEARARGEATASELERTRAELTAAEQRHADLEARVDGLETALGQERDRTEGLRAELASERGRAEALNDEVEAERRAGQEKAAALEGELERQREDAAAVARERDAERDRLEALTGDLASEREQIGALSSELHAQRGRAEALSSELAEQREAYASLAQELDAERDRADGLNTELEDVRLRVAALDVSLREHDQVDGEVVAVDDDQPAADSVALARVTASGLDRTELREVVDARNSLAAAQLEFTTAREALRTSLFAQGGDPSVAQGAVEREQQAREKLEQAQAAWDRAWGTAEAALTLAEPGAPGDQEI